MNKDIFLSMRKMLTGNVSDTAIYYTINFFCLFTHLTYMIIFLVINITPLFFVNMFSVILYLSIMFLISKHQSTKLLVATFIEIALHSALATIILGWDSGFYLLIIILIPLLFFCKFNMTYAPYVYSILSIGLFFVLRFFTFAYQPSYKILNHEAVNSGLYIMNSFLCFSALLMFSVISYKTNRYARQQLINENTELKTVVNFDPLTGLLNRRSMMKHLKEAEVQRADRGYLFSLVLADIDDFKHVNDKYGHDCGDYVLTSLAKIMTSCVKNDDAICRWGGEEILLMIKNSDKKKATIVAEDIRKTIEDYDFHYNDNHFRITITMGVSAENLQIHDMILQADQYLYFGKKHGKNIVVS